MKQEMRKAFDEAIEKFENVETFILIVSDDENQMNYLHGKCAKALSQLIVESAEAMKIVEDAIKHAKIQIKINELVAEVKKYGVDIPEMDDEDEVEAEKE